MTGHYRMNRGWMENPVFRREPYTRAQAWCFLIEKAAWKARVQPMGSDSIPVERGECAASIRFLAQRWKWNKTKVERFLARLESENMLTRTRSKTGTPITIIRVCNYDKYQATPDESGTEVGQHRDTSGTKDKKEERKEEKNRGPYSFEGKVIKLTETDFTRWEQTFKNIPNLRAVLEGRDAWLSEQPEGRRKSWFQSTAAWLANKDAEFAKSRPADGEEIDPKWRERQELAEAALKEKAGDNVIPGHGSDREPERPAQGHHEP